MDAFYDLCVLARLRLSVIIVHSSALFNLAAGNEVMYFIDSLSFYTTALNVTKPPIAAR